MSTPISTSTLIPLSANYTYDDYIKIKSTVAQWQDGYVTYIHPAFDNNKDTSSNNNSLLYLTSAMNLFSIIEETPLTTLFLGDYVILSIDNQYVTNVSNDLYVTPTSSDNSFFRFIGNDDNTYSILHSKGLYVTVDALNPYNLTLQSQDITEDSKYQKFNVESNGSQLYIMTQADGVERYWSYTKIGPEQGRVRANGSIANNDYIFSVNNFSARYSPVGLTRDHTCVNYYNQLENGGNNHNVEINQSISAVNVSHLFDLPYNTKITASQNTMNVNFANMKNIQNANYEYNNFSESPIPSTVYLREYNRIYTGTNQEFGYENPYFGFTTDDIQSVMRADKITYFHYPITAPSGLLVDSTLVKDGAVAGNIPYHSDKIWKKMANYASTSIWGNSQPIGKQTGVWLCAWLSADQNNLATIPVWMDRWYNPGYIDSTTAMFISNPLSSLVVDVSSEMIFDAGCWYKYYHVGSIANSNFVYSLTGNNNTNLKLHLDMWSQNPIDLSPYNNTSKIENYTDEAVSTNGVNVLERPTDDCFNLNGINQHCQTLHNSSYALTGDMTCSIWAYAEDWASIKGSHIISKNHRGGWDIKYNNGFFNPYMLVANTSGTIALGNINGFIYYSKVLPATSNPVAAAFDTDLFTWVLDNGIYNGSKHLYKIDYNGDILNQVIIASGESLVDLTLDANENGWVLTEAGNISGFDSYMNLVATYTTSLTGSLDVDLNNGVSAFAYSRVCFDNLNNVWGVSGNTLYKNGSAIFGTQIMNVACDKDDNLWVLQGNNEFVKLTNDGTYILSGTVGIDVATTHRGLDFTNEYDSDDQYSSYVWFINENEQYVYKYDMNGVYITKINLILYNLNPAIEKFTSYDWNRKFNYLRYGKVPQIQTDIYLNTSTLSGSRYTLSVPVTTISNRDWHMFTFTFNQSAAKFYMDSVLRDSYSTSYDKYISYEYENPLMIGANVGHILTLDDELDTEYLHFNGKIDDIRIYNIPLTESDIRHLYLNKFNYSDLLWNIPTGERNYIEEIVRFFKFKAPGQKAQYYNINLIGLNIQDEDTRTLIEDIIKKTIKKVTPAYAELYRIIWK